MNQRRFGLGDSFTFGFGVELEESFLSVAERSLWDRAPQLDVGIYKMGLNGTSQAVQLEALKAKWVALRPELVSWDSRKTRRAPSARTPAFCHEFIP